MSAIQIWRAATATLRGTVSYEFTSSFTGTLTNWNGADSFKIEYARVGKVVTLNFTNAGSPGSALTSANPKPNTNDPVTDTAIPSGYRPAGLVNIPLWGVLGSATALVVIVAQIGTNGIIDFSTLTNGVWGTANAAKVQPFSCSYVAA